jgi:hypothetical protein
VSAPPGVLEPCKHGFAFEGESSVDDVVLVDGLPDRDAFGEGKNHRGLGLLDILKAADSALDHPFGNSVEDVTLFRGEEEVVSHRALFLLLKRLTPERFFPHFMQFDTATRGCGAIPKMSSNESK